VEEKHIKSETETNTQSNNNINNNNNNNKNNNNNYINRNLSCNCELINVKYKYLERIIIIKKDLFNGQSSCWKCQYQGIPKFYATNIFIRDFTRTRHWTLPSDAHPVP
jgi:hypothetical protein